MIGNELEENKISMHIDTNNDTLERNIDLFSVIVENRNAWRKPLVIRL